MLQTRKTEELIMEHFLPLFFFFFFNSGAFFSLHALCMIFACVYKLRAEIGGNQKHVKDAVDTA